MSCTSVHICDSEVSIVFPEWYDYLNTIGTLHQLEFSALFAAFVGAGTVDISCGC